MAEEQRTRQVPTSVYRYYDPRDLLLYVGITSRGSARNREHNASKDWWQYVARQEVEHYPTRGAAEQRERTLIRKYRPPFNTLHNVDPAGARAAYLAIQAAMVGPTGSAAKPRPDWRKRPRHLLLTTKPLGASTLLLRSLDSDAWFASDIDLRLGPDFIIASGGRKAQVDLLTRSRGILQARVITRQAELCGGASMMLRFESKKHAPERVTIKRIDLDFGVS